jgi:hypothetical protein
MKIRLELRGGRHWRQHAVQRHAHQFQLIAAFLNTGGPGVPEIIQNLNGTPVIKDNGSTVSAANYTISGQGLVTFNTPPVRRPGTR